MKKLKTVLAFSSLLLVSAAWADAPAQVKQQVPGYYRLAVGEYEVTALFSTAITTFRRHYSTVFQTTRFVNCWLSIKSMPTACRPPLTLSWLIPVNIWS